MWPMGQEIKNAVCKNADGTQLHGWLCTLVQAALILYIKIISLSAFFVNTYREIILAKSGQSGYNAHIQYLCPFDVTALVSVYRSA